MKKQGLCILKMNHFEYNYRYESFIAGSVKLDMKEYERNDGGK